MTIAIRQIPVTSALMACNIFIYGLMALDAGSLSFSPAFVFAWGGSYPSITLWDEPWRLVTQIFVHFTLFHLLGNMSCLYAWGQLTEPRLKAGKMLCLYFLCGIGASFCSALYNDNAVCAGASGAISGLLGLVIAMRLQGDPQIDTKMLVTNLGLNIVLAILYPVDWVAHAAGLACGVGSGLLVLRNSDGPVPPHTRPMPDRLENDPPHAQNGSLNAAYDKLARLARLRDSGIISEKEFENQKNIILDRL